MKILLDECVPRRFKTVLSGYECQTVPEAGLAGQKNGALLSLAEASGFGLFVTMDKGIQYQQCLAGRNIAILIIRAHANSLAALLPLSDQCRSVLQSIRPGEVIQVGEPSSS